MEECWGGNLGWIGGCSRTRLEGIEGVLWREMGVKNVGIGDGCVDDGWGDEWRVDGVLTEKLGEGVAVP